MTKHEITHIIKDIFRQLKKTIPPAAKNSDQDSIHKFRVQIKKLRAFLRLLSFEPRSLKVPKSLKKVYSVAGQVRSLQLQLSKTINPSKKNNGLTQYHKQLENDLDSRMEELKILFDEKNILSKEKKIISKIPENIDNLDIVNFYQSKIKTINAMIVLGKFSDEELHRIRKLIKDMIYVSKILQESGVQLLQIDSLKEENLSFAENIAQELGLFNDISSGLQLLIPGVFSEISPEEENKLESIRLEWNLRKENLKADLIRLITAAPIFRTTV